MPTSTIVNNFVAFIHCRKALTVLSSTPYYSTICLRSVYVLSEIQKQKLALSSLVHSIQYACLARPRLSGQSPCVSLGQEHCRISMPHFVDVVQPLCPTLCSLSVFSISHISHALKPPLPTNTQHSYNLRNRQHSFALMGRSAEYHLHANVVWWQHRNEPLARPVHGP